MRRSLLLALTLAGAMTALVLLAGSAAAGPADPSVRTLRQPDGSTFAARLYGDELLNGWETAAGYTVLQGPGGVWSFARADDDGRLTRTGIRPGPTGVPPTGADLDPHLRDAADLREAGADRESATTQGSGPLPPQTGTQDVLVVLTQFADTSLSTTAADWSDLFFGAGPSVRSYYDDASFGTLDLAPAAETDGTVDDGVVTVTLPTPHPDAGNQYGLVEPVVAAALTAADGAVDLSAHDADNDGRLAADELHLAVVVAGTEASQSCAGPSIWAHRSSLAAGPTLDGVVVGDYEVTGGYVAGGELQCDGPPALATVGIWVHEMGHDLGLIDLYDIDGSSGGVDAWSVMGTHWLALPGERIGTRPPLMDPFSRWQLGWLTPDHLTTPTGGVALGSAAATGDVVQVLDNPDGVDVDFLGGSGQGEYFLVENRQQDGWDVALPGCGIVVWHIDESRGSNQDDDARRVDVEEAGDRWFNRGWADSEDPYPSETPANTAFGPTTQPNSNQNSGVPSGVTLDGFDAACAPIQHVDVDPGGALPARPSNDRLAAARPIRIGTATAQVHAQVRGHNIGATAQPAEPVHRGATGRSTVWWSVRAPKAGYLNITSESTFREVVAVYTGPHVGALDRVHAVVGTPPGSGGAGRPENVYRGLGFRVERNVRYLIAVDSRSAGDTGGVRLFVDFESARPDVRAVPRVVAPGERPLLRVQVRNTNDFDRLRVYGMDEGGTTVSFTDCPSAFVLAPGQSRVCHVRSRQSGPTGATLGAKLTLWVQWLDLGRYTYLSDPWTAEVRSP